MRRYAWQLYLILMVNILLKGVAGCSTFCACKWKNGKQTVECTNRSLTEIPDGMAPETQVLEFSGNNLDSLQKDLFLKKQIINLQRIYLANCKIRVIDSQTFNGLTNLVELDLSHNSLDAIPSEAFKNCPSLMKLTLNFNRIKSLKKFAFNQLSYLNTLELSNCEIGDVEEGAFQGLHSLEWLHLDGNRLKTIRGRRTLPENVKGVELQKNRWECDCHIQDLFAWLQDFRIPLYVEPVCHGPSRLAGRAIKSISATELACLADISPTTFYLELGEGKNVSLLCHVHAIPEATVSWWFQGQMLQNNTMVAPGVHLIYFVEEGSENKRSELFIFNANAEDNGTFICNAENAAGTTQSNFTIRIILKEDPIVIIVSFPIEYFLCAVIAAAVLALIIAVLFMILIWKCYRKRTSQVKTKKQMLQNANKCSALRSESSSINAVVPLTMDDASLKVDEDMIAHCEDELFNAMSPAGAANQGIRSPSSLRRYQLEQNPDLINGTESIGCRREGDGGEDEQTLETAIPIACLRASREFYPMDYGLPKIPYQTQCNGNYYRTLPSCTRMKRRSQANPISRFSRDAEFLSRSVDSPYEPYQTDIRYTADGYPARTAPENTSPPASLPCCSIQWPTCVPANLHMVQPVDFDGDPCSVSKRCVSAQTDNTKSSESKIDCNRDLINTQNGVVNEVLTESPDEGYEGEPTVV